jgi:hypothetical protein
MEVVYDSIRIIDKPFSCREQFNQHGYVFTALRRGPDSQCFVESADCA